MTRTAEPKVEAGNAPIQGPSGALVLVTGASRGVGAATVHALVTTHSARVIAVARDQEALLDLASRYPDLIEIHRLDISDADAPRNLSQAVAGRRLSAIVHNAGLLHRATMGQHRGAELDHLFRVNVTAPLLITQALAEQLAGDPPGHVVHISSMGGFQDSAKFPGLVAYSSSKAALACMAQCLAEEFREQGIRSNCLALGAVDTEMLRAAFPGYAAPVTAEAMGAYVAWFAMAGHFFHNGKVLPVALSTP